MHIVGYRYKEKVFTRTEKLKEGRRKLRQQSFLQQNVRNISEEVTTSTHFSNGASRNVYKESIRFFAYSLLVVLVKMLYPTFKLWVVGMRKERFKGNNFF